MMTATVEIATEALMRASQNSVSVERLTALEEMPLQVGYQIQMDNLRRRLESGEVHTGWKVAITNQKALDKFSVTEPASGPLTQSMAVINRGSIPRNELLRPKLEAELAFIVGENLTKSCDNDEQLLNHVASVAPAIEIADCRIRDWAFNATSFVADNAAAGKYCLGEALPFHQWDRSGPQCDLFINDSPVAQGQGSYVSGGPIASFLWLIKSQLRQGGMLKKGDVVLTGSMTPPLDIHPGDDIRLRMFDNDVQVHWAQ
ncbi:hypothetical protein HBA55_01755 [Pseudomaricurvus alkylphenolicus]|uniref:2-keto-4-pentenoate hydratase n=1 Tax=Pseudomaricurvus alkylphenolicus TaxID=1306991 RepID=UPI00141F064D|nr:fumarylacetoacetate hydrolase family protein [Pseudomaricurvus alkylphenolicus]NIB38288.1 hypothetical protein [Pseudomaricurvus alkylphenolicus]